MVNARNSSILIARFVKIDVIEKCLVFSWFNNMVSQTTRTEPHKNTDLRRPAAA